MKLKSVRIRDFRRFTNLTIEGIPQTARLIIIVGPNGCGKSSLFDAFHTWHQDKIKRTQWDKDYHGKVGSGTSGVWKNQVIVEFHGEESQERRKIFYVRSAYRNEPEFQMQGLERIGDPLDVQRVRRMIDNDSAVRRNYQRLVCRIFEVFDMDQDERGEFIENILQPLRHSIIALFPDLKIHDISNPIDNGTFRFTKGASDGFPFKNLSGGEKAAFDLILDFVVASLDYDDTIFCIDEPESHMHARLQAQLLSVLYNIIPENCQLILATHSIGMIRRARDIEKEYPGSVVFLDFGDRDFDKAEVLTPTKPSRRFWEQAYDVALDDLAALMAPERIVICEGHPKTQKSVGNHSHDARCYERIFEDEFPETKFVSMGGDKQITNDYYNVAEAFGLLISGVKIVRLIDRDDRSDQDIVRYQNEGIRVLSWRNLESYLFHDEVLRALAISVDKASQIDELLAAKEKIRNARDDRDDLKLGSGEIYAECQKILGLTQRGEDAKSFMRDTLAPLVKPNMLVYEQLKCDIFGDTKQDDNK